MTGSFSVRSMPVQSPVNARSHPVFIERATRIADRMGVLFSAAYCNFQRKAAIKEKELELKKMELDVQERKWVLEEEERGWS